MAEIAQSTVTSIIYESPLRIVKTLQQLSAACGPDRECTVCREISKLHEQNHNGTLQSLAQYFNNNPAKGEIVLIVAPKPEQQRAAHKNKYKDADEAEGQD